MLKAAAAAAEPSTRSRAARGSGEGEAHGDCCWPRHVQAAWRRRGAVEALHALSLAAAAAAAAAVLAPAAARKGSYEPFFAAGKGRVVACDVRLSVVRCTWCVCMLRVSAIMPAAQRRLTLTGVNEYPHLHTSKIAGFGQFRG